MRPLSSSGLVIRERVSQGHTGKAACVIYKHREALRSSKMVTSRGGTRRRWLDVLTDLGEEWEGIQMELPRRGGKRLEPCAVDRFSVGREIRMDVQNRRPRAGAIAHG